MIKNYLVSGKQFQYEEGKQPEGAVEVKKVAEPSRDKVVKSANKARKAVKK